VRLESVPRFACSLFLLASPFYAYMPALGFLRNHAFSYGYLLALIALGYEFHVGFAPLAAVDALKIMGRDMTDRFSRNARFVRLTSEQIFSNLPELFRPKSQARVALHDKKMDGSPIFVCRLVDDPDTLSSAAYAYIIPGKATNIFIHADLEDFCKLSGVARFQFLHELGHCSSVGRVAHESTAHVQTLPGFLLALGLLVLGGESWAIIAFFLCTWFTAMLYRWIRSQSNAIEQSADVFACAAIGPLDAEMVLSFVENQNDAFFDPRFSPEGNASRRRFIAHMLRGRLGDWDIRTWEHLQGRILFPWVALAPISMAIAGSLYFGYLSGLTLPTLSVGRFVCVFIVAALGAAFSLHATKIASIPSAVIFSMQEGPANNERSEGLTPS